jgi:hypothetical protein
MLHTIQEAVKLTGKSRRTIYDHCTQGRVSYSVGDDGRRYFETSELIRAYGPLRGYAHPEPVQSAQARTPIHDDFAEVLAAAVADAVARAIAPLLERLEAVELKRIEHKPEPPEDSFADIFASLSKSLSKNRANSDER